MLSTHSVRLPSLSWMQHPNSIKLIDILSLYPRRHHLFINMHIFDTLCGIRLHHQFINNQADVAWNSLISHIFLLLTCVPAYLPWFNVSVGAIKLCYKKLHFVDFNCSICDHHHHLHNYFTHHFI